MRKIAVAYFEEQHHTQELLMGLYFSYIIVIIKNLHYTLA